MEFVGLGDERTPSGKHSSLEGVTVRLTKLCICIGTTSHRPSMCTDRVYAVCGESSAMVISMVYAAEPSRFVLQGKPLGVCNM
jgi:hypothetical protein